MLKKIRIEQLQVGMYVHTLCGAWLAHDFWRTSFLVDTTEVLAKLRASPVQEVWIDTRKGLNTTQALPASVLAAFAEDTTPASLNQELERASAMCDEASDAVMRMFSEARMGRALDLSTASTLVQAVCSSVERHPDALISMARLKTSDNYTYMHSVAVCGLMVALARKMELSEAQIMQAGMAGLLHDMGKAHSDPNILNKPGALTDEEFKHMQRHPVKGFLMLQGSVQDEGVLDACLHHHERMDGKGYPHGLAGADIRLLTRMTTICDVYDAITSDRPYKKGWAPGVALQRMAQWCHTHLDAQIFETFVKAIGLYPVGSLVRLQSGLLGVVCAPAQNSMSTPQVAAFYHIGLQRMLRPAKLLDLEKLPDERIVAGEDPSKWPFTNLEQLWQKAVATASA
ncbi:HD-GYP domain-containing protein [Comamonas sp.]|uniref:HD-GYP domain-containing protein n=1 Tax=Comamonas sp. TaxID=34028 RepID=UPI0028978B2B|nr:HD-GYP domain-containing protein [Comamonas sp.]